MSIKKALSDIEAMRGEAETILDILCDLRLGVALKDGAEIRSALDALADETYSYSGGIVGFRPRTDAIRKLLEKLEAAKDKS
jgi:hypothetical protein